MSSDKCGFIRNTGSVKKILVLRKKKVRGKMLSFQPLHGKYKKCSKAARILLVKFLRDIIVEKLQLYYSRI